jgi:hypothetical protein
MLHNRVLQLQLLVDGMLEQQETEYKCFHCFPDRVVMTGHLEVGSIAAGRSITTPRLVIDEVREDAAAAQYYEDNTASSKALSLHIMKDGPDAGDVVVSGPWTVLRLLQPDGSTETLQDMSQWLDQRFDGTAHAVSDINRNLFVHNTRITDLQQQLNNTVVDVQLVKLKQVSCKTDFTE